MYDQDRKAVECLCSCGLDFEGICRSFPEFSVDEIKQIFITIRDDEEIDSILQLQLSC